MSNKAQSYLKSLGYSDSEIEVMYGGNTDQDAPEGVDATISPEEAMQLQGEAASPTRDTTSDAATAKALWAAVVAVAQAESTAVVDECKPSNPKDALGVRKTPMSTVPAQVIAEIGLGILEGSCKYGRHNYRVIGVRSSVYYDATMRHMMAWWEGQDTDPDSGLNHVTKAMSSLAVLRDAMLSGMLNDDRPPPIGDSNWIAKLNAKAAEILDKYEGKIEAPYTKNGRG